MFLSGLLTTHHFTTHHFTTHHFTTHHPALATLHSTGYYCKKITDGVEKWLAELKLQNQERIYPIRNYVMPQGENPASKMPA
jgi:hypothetical protein